MSAAARPDPVTGSRKAEDLAVWARLAPSGLLLVGAGLCVTSDAATRRAAHHRDAARRGLVMWLGEGTAGLVLVGAGLSLFGEAVKRRALHDVAERG